MDREDPTLTPGQDNTQVLGLDFHNPVFPLSALAILLFILYALVYPDAANTQLGLAKSWSIEHFDWLQIDNHHGGILLVPAVAWQVYL